MRKIRGAAFISLDGVIQGPGGVGEDTTGGFEAGGWVFRLWDDAAGEEVDRLFGHDYDLLLGRRTYDIFAAYWPYVEGEAAVMGEAFTAANKYVLTRGDAPLGWDNSIRLGGIADVAALKRQDGPDLVIQGSSTLYPPLLAAGMIDQLTLMIFPVVLGKGKRLFGEGSVPSLLELVAYRASAKGTIIATYQQRGDLPPMPDFAPPASTSEREAERQKAMKRGEW
ncbi:dihydrofolate reductase family protein [Porphyrobacter sp. ULC335]|uniref:dihydrofolate reductase family protein n=1 Tax=Porphyrobacter sp. ULC335 TaxID=2854260 RepID=UPI00221E4D24|nr:dihydrofolate reductase family protein [Porphyrobacter sp. ULC335]UYV16671.1 dihydrofolate reductase family protein [Porphyrobacter sp. ULC335]